MAGKETFSSFCRSFSHEISIEMFALINGSDQWSRAVWRSIAIARTTRLREMRGDDKGRVVLASRKQEVKS